MSTRAWIMGAGVFALVGMSTLWALSTSNPGAPGLSRILVDEVAVEPVNLIRHDGAALNAAFFQDQWTFVFFGFTNCPDVCPSTLYQLANLSEALQSRRAGNTYRFLFVSVDPARDTPARINEYVKYFNKGFAGATGTPEAIEQFESYFNAVHRLEKSRPDAKNYNVVHSSEIYIVDPRGRWIGKWQPPLDLKQVKEQLALLDRYLQQQQGGTG